MKTIQILASVAILTLAVSCGSSKKATVLETDAQKRVKEWKSEGWKLTGAYSTFTMESLLENHNAKVADEERYTSINGTGIGSELSDARMFAMNDATIQYATAAGSVVNGGMATQFSKMAESGRKLMGAYTQKVAEFISPYMKESLSLYRNLNGKVEVSAYYLIDEQNAGKVRSRAMDEALKETALEQVFGTAVDEWVKKFVNGN